MFVKVIEFDEKNRETIYQCGQIRFRYTDSIEAGNEERDLLIEMEGCPDRGSLAIQCVRKSLSIYIMNDAGRTIDNYHYDSGQKVNQA